ncbi:MAG TPA: PqqD family peptide modification chaperone [Levilinea sp.]|nr:PqqD family peptide modification chaperone [Levilinea sp.]
MRLRLRLRWLRMCLCGRRALKRMKSLTGLKASVSSWLFKEPLLQPPAPGIYHYPRQHGNSKVRLHLRVEPGGHAILIVNASRMYHFNPTAAFMTYLLLEGIALDQAVAACTTTFNVSTSQARQDFSAFSVQLDDMIAPDGGCPVCDLNLEVTAPFSDRPSAPYRMDLALTYRCQNDCAHCYNVRGRRPGELSTHEWRQALDRLWQIGVPHIVFTGGEPTLRPDLPDLIAHAEQNGQIVGLNTNARRLKDAQVLQQLVAAGLDHIQITLESHLPEVHDAMVGRAGAWQDTVAGIRNALNSPLFVMTNTTMLHHNAAGLAGTLDFLADLGVPTIGLNALIYSGSGLSAGTGLPESSLPPLLELARQRTSASGQQLIWYTPTQYCHFDPLLLDLGVKGCTAALYNMCIEPDGSVIPCQSYYQPLGSFLSDPWESIWRHDLAVSLRERKDAHPVCSGCVAFEQCGGGCPLARRACITEKPAAINSLPPA